MNNVSEMLSMSYGRKRRVSVFLRGGLELQDSRSYVPNYRKDSSGRMEDQRKSNRLADQAVYGLKLGQDYPRHESKNELQNGQKNM